MRPATRLAMEKYPEAHQLIQPLDTGAKNSYLGH
jgi:hypothetical protein